MSISEFIRSQSSSTYQKHSLRYIVNARRWLYEDTGVMVVDRVMGSLYSPDPRVDRYYLISISTCHTLKIHTLSFQTFSVTHSFHSFVDPGYCLYPPCQVEIYLLTRFQLSSNPNRCLWWSLFGCCEQCGRVLMVSVSAFSQHCFTTMASKWCMSKYSQWACPGAPPIMLKYHLEPDRLYGYIKR